MDEQSALIQLVVDRLDAAGIPYMLTGSMALALYASPRMTRDIDLVIDCDQAGADRLVAAFERDSYVSREAVQEAVAHRSMFNIIFEPSVSKVDFILRKDDAYRRTEFGRRRPLAFGERTVWVVAPEDLLLSKLHWAQQSDSERQLRDAASILKVQDALDRDYLRAWAERLGVLSELERVEHL